MFLVRCVSLFAACLLATTYARPATRTENPLLSEFFRNVGNLTVIDAHKLQNLELSDQKIYVQFTNFGDQTFVAFKTARPLVEGAKAEMQRSVGIYGPDTPYAKFFQDYPGFYLRFLSFPPAAPKGLSTYPSVRLILPSTRIHCDQC